MRPFPTCNGHACPLAGDLLGHVRPLVISSGMPVSLTAPNVKYPLLADIPMPAVQWVYDVFNETETHSLIRAPTPY